MLSSSSFILMSKIQTVIDIKDIAPSAEVKIGRCLSTKERKRRKIKSEMKYYHTGITHRQFFQLITAAADLSDDDFPDDLVLSDRRGHSPARPNVARLPNSKTFLFVELSGETYVL